MIALVVRPAITPAVALTMVTCADCNGLVSREKTLSFEYIEAIDGDETNLVASNIRHTGRIGYQCYGCVELYEGVKLGSEDA